MIRRIRLRNFKGFEQFDLPCGATTFLVGPNNAGKSTVLAALRAASQMRRVALSRVADTAVDLDASAPTPAWSVGPDQIQLNVENLRFEFRNIESSLEVQFSNGARLHAFWPPGSEPVPDDGYFSFKGRGGAFFSRPTHVRDGVPTIGFVPLLTPLEQEEPQLQEKTVRGNLATRLSSRQFRNQLHLLGYRRGEPDFRDFQELVEQWAPELTIRSQTSRLAPGGLYLDLFYLERGSTTEKEIFWAGDGMQIWLQVLLHVMRLEHEGTDTIILDEPDVYLHADLQRRMVRLLEATDAQTITATHSAEVLGEAAPDELVWVTRDRKEAVTPAENNQLAALSAAIGTPYNVRFAKALGARVVLFVEGQDMKVLGNLAATVGADRVAREEALAVIPLGGFSNWEHVEPFTWLANELLQGAVDVVVLVDRDYRPDTVVVGIEDRLTAAGIDAHVWRRKELESYLLIPAAIARTSGADVAMAQAILDRQSAAMESSVAARMLDEHQRLKTGPKAHRVSVTEEFYGEFSRLWHDTNGRAMLCPAKRLLAGVNRELVASGYRAVSVQALSREIEADEVDEEMRDVLLRLDRRLRA